MLTYFVCPLEHDRATTEAGHDFVCPNFHFYELAHLCKNVHYIYMKTNDVVRPIFYM